MIKVMKWIAIIFIIVSVYGIRLKRRAVSRMYKRFDELGITDHWHVKRDWEEAKSAPMYKFLWAAFKEWWG